MSDFLQEIRKKEIPNIIEKYRKVVDNILEAVSKPTPKFSDIRKEEDIIKTAEEQLFSFLNTRDRAIDNANEILKKVNELERELYDPDYYKNLESKEDATASKSNTNKNLINQFKK